MAWIKMQTHLPDKPEVLGIGEKLGIPDAHVIGLLFCVWSMADTQADADGRIENCSLRLIDRKVGHDGFAEAMAKVSWLVVDGDDIVFPNYQHHNGSTAKSRAQIQKRVEKHRQMGSKTKDVTQGRYTSVTAPLPDKNRVEEIREDREDHRRKEGGAGGDSSAIYHKVWGPELIAQVRRIAADRFGFIRDAGWSNEDRITLLRLAALEAGGVVAEAWLSDGVAATKAAMSAGTVQKSPTAYVFGVLRDSCRRYNQTTIDLLMGPLLLPDELRVPTPKKYGGTQYVPDATG